MALVLVSRFCDIRHGHPDVTVCLFRCRVRPPIDWGHADFEAPELRSNGRAGTVTAPGGGRGSLTYRYDHVFAQGRLSSAGPRWRGRGRTPSCDTCCCNALTYLTEAVLHTTGKLVPSV
jgi:hypothetical protein